MTTTVEILLLVLGFICFILAVWPWPSTRINLVALGLAFVTASQLVGHITVT